MTRRNTVLITGGAIGDLPYLVTAKRIGWRIVTSGTRPQDPGHRLANEYVYADYSDEQQMLEVVQKVDADAIFPSCHDRAAVAADAVARQAGLPTPYPENVVATVSNKLACKRILARHALPVATEIEVEEAAEILQRGTGQVVVKPLDLAGGRGVHVVNDVTALRDAIQSARAISPSGQALIEEYLSGSMHGVSLLIEAGQILHRIIDDEHYREGSFRVASTTFPSRLSSEHQRTILDIAQQAVTLLSIQAGLVHMQVMWRGDPVIIEIALRPPGDWYHEFAFHATGVDFAVATLSPHLGLSPWQQHQRPTLGPRPEALMRTVIVTKESGSFQHLTVVCEESDSYWHRLAYVRRPLEVIPEGSASPAAIVLTESGSPDRLPSLASLDAKIVASTMSTFEVSS